MNGLRASRICVCLEDICIFAVVVPRLPPNAAGVVQAAVAAAARALIGSAASSFAWKLIGGGGLNPSERRRKSD